MYSSRITQRNPHQTQSSSPAIDTGTPSVLLSKAAYTHPLVVSTIRYPMAVCRTAGRAHTMEIKQDILCISLSNPMHLCRAVKANCVCKIIPSFAPFRVPVVGACVCILCLERSCFLKQPTHDCVQDVAIDRRRSSFSQQRDDQILGCRGHFDILADVAKY